MAAASQGGGHAPVHPQRTVTSLWGTLNVDGLENKLPRVLDVMNLWNLDLVCMQEVWTPHSVQEGLRRLASRAGFHLHFGIEAPWDGRGRCSCLATLSRLQLQELGAMEGVTEHERVQFLAVPRGRRAGAVALAKVYGHSGSMTTARRDTFLRQVAQSLRRYDQVGCVMMGDLNCKEDEGAVAEVAANGVLHAVDASFDQLPGATRERGRGRIDQALASTQLVCKRRPQAMGVSDHDLVAYEFEGIKRGERRRVAPRRRVLRTSGLQVADEALEASLSAVDFQYALDQVQMDRAWTLLSDAAEDVLASGAHTGARRSEKWTPVEIEYHVNAEGVSEPVRVRRLQRLCRQMRELRRHPEQQHSLRRACLRRCQALAYLDDRLQALTRWNVEEGLECAEELLAREEASASRRRLDTWHAKMEESVAQQRRRIRRTADERLRRSEELGRVCPRHGVAEALPPLERIDQQEHEWFRLWDRPALAGDAR